MNLGKFKIQSKIGQGGFGTVYQASDVTLDRTVALKVLLAEHRENSKLVNAFLREARHMARISHPNVIQVYEAGEIESQVFMAMKFCEGGSLEQKIKVKGALRLQDAIRMLYQVGQGLDAGHRIGLIHRDVKPSNILFDADGKALIGDFGLSKAILSTEQATGETITDFSGTPFYVPPELWQGTTQPTPAADIYSLACVFYEAVTGEVLFTGDSFVHILSRHVLETPSFSEKLPGQLATPLMTALAKKPEERFQSINEFLMAVRSSFDKRNRQVSRHIAPEPEPTNPTKSGEVSFSQLVRRSAGLPGLNKAATNEEDIRITTSKEARVPSVRAVRSEPATNNRSAASAGQASSRKPTPEAARIPTARKPLPPSAQGQTIRQQASARPPDGDGPGNPDLRPSGGEQGKSRRSLMIIVAAAVVFVLLGAWFLASGRARSLLSGKPTSTITSTATSMWTMPTRTSTLPAEALPAITSRPTSTETARPTATATSSPLATNTPWPTYTWVPTSRPQQPTHTATKLATNTKTPTVTYPVTATPTAPPSQYTLTVVIIGQGSVNPPGGSFSVGLPIVLTASPASGWEFESWNGCDSTSGVICSITMNSDRTITVSFKELPRYYTVSLSAGSGGTVSGGGTFPEHTKVTIIAMPNAGFVFDRWGGDCTGQAPSFTLTIVSDVFCDAMFELVGNKKQGYQITAGID